MRVSLDYRGAAVYVRQKDAFVDAFLRRKRERFPGSRMILRQEGVRAIVAAAPRPGLAAVPRHGSGRARLDFRAVLGVPAATVPALSRIARLAGARVVLLVVRQLPGARGYEARFYPAWEKFPSGDVTCRHTLHERIPGGAHPGDARAVPVDAPALQDPSERRVGGVLECWFDCVAMKIRFTKMHGAGNDFVVLDAVRQPMRLNSATARRLADRHFGVGCDQILVIERPRSRATDFYYRIFNADGAEVQHCWQRRALLPALRARPRPHRQDRDPGRDSVRRNRAEAGGRRRGHRGHGSAGARAGSHPRSWRSSLRSPTGSRSTGSRWRSAPCRWATRTPCSWSRTSSPRRFSRKGR